MGASRFQEIERSRNWIIMEQAFTPGKGKDSLHPIKSSAPIAERALEDTGVKFPVLYTEDFSNDFCFPLILNPRTLPLIPSLWGLDSTLPGPDSLNALFLCKIEIN